MDNNPEMHRKLGIDLFNYVWTLIEKPERTIMENDAMIHAAHASRHHWAQVGTAVNLTRGEWQISRVYSILERSEPAIYHAKRCLEICLDNQIGDFDLAFAYEALARGFALNKQWEEALKNLELAKTAGDQIAEKEDRDWFLQNLETIPPLP